MRKAVRKLHHTTGQYQQRLAWVREVCAPSLPIARLGLLKLAFLSIRAEGRERYHCPTLREEGSRHSLPQMCEQSE